MFNPFMDEENFGRMQKYGLDIGRINPVEIECKLYEGDVKTNRYLMTLNLFMWPPETFEQAFIDAGFEHFEWVHMHLSEDPTGSDQHLFHKDFVDYPMLIMFKARRPHD